MSALSNLMLVNPEPTGAQGVGSPRTGANADTSSGAFDIESTDSDKEDGFAKVYAEVGADDVGENADQTSAQTPRQNTDADSPSQGDNDLAAESGNELPSSGAALPEQTEQQELNSGNDRPYGSELVQLGLQSSMAGYSNPFEALVSLGSELSSANPQGTPGEDIVDIFNRAAQVSGAGEQGAEVSTAFRQFVLAADTGTQSSQVVLPSGSAQQALSAQLTGEGGISGTGVTTTVTAGTTTGLEGNSTGSEWRQQGVSSPVSAIGLAGLGTASANESLQWSVSQGDYGVPAYDSGSWTTSAGIEGSLLMGQLRPISILASASAIAQTTQLDFASSAAPISQAAFSQGPLQQFTERLNAILSTSSALGVSVEKAATEGLDTSGTLGVANNLASNSATNTQTVTGAIEAANTALSARAEDPLQTTASTKPAQTAVTIPFNQPRWSEEFAQHISLLAGQRISSAEIRLDPPELGPLMVKIDLSGDQATVNFVSAHGVVRDALEQTIPRLQELLAQEGYDLLNVDISDQQLAQGGDDEASGEASGNDSTDEAQATAGREVQFEKQGIVDYYA